jgi:hypothetical protein
LGGTLHQVVATESYPDAGVTVDAALLKIDPPAGSDGIGFASTEELGVGQTVGLLGWGMSDLGSSTSSVLNQVDVQVVASPACVGVNEAELCVEDPTNLHASACFGDSGGPALLFRGGSYALAGIATRCGGLSPKCEGSTVYVSAPYVSSWVTTVMGS